MDESSTYEALKQRVSQLEKQNELLQSEVTKYRTLLDSLPHGISVSDVALRESEEKYRKLYEDAAIGIFHSSFEGRFLDVNPALARMLGYETPHDVVDSIYSISEQIYVEPQARDEVIAQVLAKGETIKVENRYRRRDGSEWNAYLHLKYVFDANGQPICLEGFVEDITERKQVEGKMLYLQKSESLGRMAGAVAHHFNNQLSVVMGNLELVLEGLPVDAKIRKNLSQAFEWEF